MEVNDQHFMLQMPLPLGKANLQDVIKMATLLLGMKP
jgi:hypothetical protein